MGDALEQLEVMKYIKYPTDKTFLLNAINKRKENYLVEFFRF